MKAINASMAVSQQVERSEFATYFLGRTENKNIIICNCEGINISVFQAKILTGCASDYVVLQDKEFLFI
jgi:hypothetical protein